MHSFKRRLLYIVAGVIIPAVSVSSFGLDNLYVGNTSISGPARISSNECVGPYTATIASKTTTKGSPTTQTSFAPGGETSPAGAFRNTVLTLSGIPRSTGIHLFDSKVVPFFSDAGCTVPITKVSIVKGASNALFYIKASSLNEYTLTATTPGYRANDFALLVAPTTSGGQHSSQNSSFVLSPTTGAIDVTNLPKGSVTSAKGDGSTDDTKAFNEAIRLASTGSTKPFLNGPSGSAQGVVYVPGGKTYRIRDVQFMDNVRMEIDAGAVIMQTQIKPNKNGLGFSVFILGSSKDRSSVPLAPLRNVSLVGVGTSTTMGGAPKPIPYTGWSLDNSFTLNVDPVATGASQNIKPIRVTNVDGLLLQNIFAIGNNSDVSNKFYNNDKNSGDGSNLESAVVVLQNQTTKGGSNFYGPTNVTGKNIYTINNIHGYGTMQIQSGRTLTFDHVFSDGGIALRLESDVVGVDTLNAHSCVRGQLGGGGAGCTCGGSYPACPLSYFSEINGVKANTIACFNGHAAVALLPHEQINQNVAITNVAADNCFNAIETGRGGDPRIAQTGSFSGVSISGVKVLGSNVNGSGTKAQGMPNLFGLDGQVWAPNVSSSRVMCVADQKVVPISSLGSCSYNGDFVQKGACDTSVQPTCAPSQLLRNIFDATQ